MKSDPRAFNLDASLLQCDLPLSLLLVKSSVALGEEEDDGWVAWKKMRLGWAEGVLLFL